MKYLLYILICVSLVGCSHVDKPKKPKNLIAKEKMSDIIYDLYILNAAKGVNRKLLELNGVMPLEYIYRKYEIDSLQFAESNTYYAFNTEIYSNIIDKVKADLEKNKNQFEILAKKDQARQDSIRAVDSKKEDSLHRIKTGN